MSLHVNQGRWWFVEGPWQEDGEGVVTSPQNADQHMAFATEKAYGDLEAEFEFRRDAWHCGVGLIVRAQDARHYYVVGFPFCGQQIREGHLWAYITRVNETGWARVLMLERVPGVPAEAGLWHQARVTVQGSEMRLWVNGRPLPPVQDEQYPVSGYVGLLNWGACSLRNLRLSGTETEAAAWDGSLQPVLPWFHPYPTSDDRQGTPGLTRAPNGDLVMVVNKSVVRSADRGRTWDEIWHAKADVDALWTAQNIGTLATTHDGRVILVRVKHLKPFVIEVASSKDNGNTWSEHEQAGEAKLPEVIKEAYMYGQILELQDGALLHFGYTYPSPYELIVEEGRRYRQANIPGMMNFCLRSEDGGRTWSDPVNIDGPNPRPELWMSFKDQASEVTAIETLEGEIVAFMRPGITWAMWETRSTDGGRTWTPLSTGPFLSYACAGPPRATASGALVVGGRFPGLAIYVSRDNGMTWETYQIDTEPWAMGGMYEVAPDVVLWVYGSGAEQLRAQFIRITPTGVEPALEMLPDS